MEGVLAVIRVLVYDRADNPLFELSENDVFELTRRDTLNGEHSLEITTTHVLSQGQRLLTQDARGVWREFVVYGIDQEHANGERPIGSYYCTWSLQPDLMGTQVSKMPGVQEPVPARDALVAALSGTKRWTVGTVTNLNTGGASMYDTDGWSAMSTLIETWGGEIGVTIVTDNNGVSERHVDYYAQMGEHEARRRFDFGEDATSVKRIIEDGAVYCRISPRGKGEETEGGGYGRKITIESVNDGKDYLENADMVELAKLPDGQGGWEYPTIMIENSDCETPAELLVWARSVLESYTTPKITYEVDVFQLAREGVDMQGVSLGDAVQVVDRKFNGLRLTGRVAELVTDELTGKPMSLVIGYVDEGLTGKFSSLQSNVKNLVEFQQALSTADYINDLLDRINTEINQTGGYTYIVSGHGIRTYDVEVSDPLIGAEASQVVEIKGGSIRIANSRTAQGEWDWRSVFTAGHIAADMVTAAQITTGYIQSANGQSYFNLDNNQLVTNNIDASGSIHADSTNSRTSISGGYNVYYYRPDADSEWEYVGRWSGTTGVTYITQEGNKTSRALLFETQQYPTTGTNSEKGYFRLDPFTIVLGFMGIGSSSAHAGTVLPRITLDSTKADGGAGITIHGHSHLTLNSTNPVTVATSMAVRDNLTVTGTKSREVSTDNYSDRLLYCYETPSPLFGDIGSGMMDSDGMCIVSVDDIFAETARTDISYQVFLQKCGEGDLWVDAKTPTYFIVRGTPGLRFDWELKAVQTDYEHLRLEQNDLDMLTLLNSETPESPETAYGDYADEIEQAYLERTADETAI